MTRDHASWSCTVTRPPNYTVQQWRDMMQRLSDAVGRELRAGGGRTADDARSRSPPRDSRNLDPRDPRDTLIRALLLRHP